MCSSAALRRRCTRRRAGSSCFAAPRAPSLSALAPRRSAPENHSPAAAGPRLRGRGRLASSRSAVRLRRCRRSLTSHCPASFRSRWSCSCQRSGSTTPVTAALRAQLHSLSEPQSRLPGHLWVSLELWRGDTDSLSKSALFGGSASVATGSILDCRHCRIRRVDEVWA